MTQNWWLQIALYALFPLSIFLTILTFPWLSLKHKNNTWRFNLKIKRVVLTNGYSFSNCFFPRSWTSDAFILLVVKYGMIRLYALGPFRLSPVGKVGFVDLFLTSTPSYQTWLSGSLPNPLETLLGTQWWMYSFSKYLRDKIRDILKTKRWSWMFACHSRFNHANLINCLESRSPHYWNLCAFLPTYVALA